MVVPDEVQMAVWHGQLDTLRGWLENGPNDVNDVDSDGTSLLYQCCASFPQTDRHVSVLEYLLSRGADVNRSRHGSLLHIAAVRQSRGPRKIVELLLGAGIQVNVRDNSLDATPLAWVINNFSLVEDRALKKLVECCLMLLRAGASLDAIGRLQNDGELKSVENFMDREIGMCPELATNEDLVVFRTIVADLRAAGTWRQYVLAPPKDLLRLRSLVARGRAKVRPHGWTPSCVARLFARSLPNEIAWRVLEYWNPRC